MNLNEVLSRLQNVKKSGAGFTARCPNHNDKQNSLSVSEKDGKVLLHCHALCSANSICAGIGIELKDLFIASSDNGQKAATGQANTKKRQIIAAYDYTDETGNLLFQAVRTEPKGFFQRRVENGKEITNLTGVRLIPYNLPEIIKNANRAVFICEGEKDVETLRAKGLVATCNPMGAGKWRDEYSEFFKDRNCYVVPDNDDAGRKHAEAVARSLDGKAKEIRIVNLPDLPEKGDVSDFLENHSVEDLKKIVKSAPAWTLTNEPESDLPASRKVSTFTFATLDDLLNEPEEEVSYVWENTLPFGGFSICSAKPKVGKSTVVRNLAVKIPRGEPFLGRGTHKGKVLYLCLEEKRGEIAKHFRKMNASGADILIYTGATPENALEAVAAAIAEHEPVFVVIDPLSRVLRVRDFNDYGGMARGLEPFVDLARKTHTHILAVHHDGKGERAGGDALLGSTALFGSVDCHIQMRKRERGRTILTTNRYGEDLPETVIELDKETGIITAQGDLQAVVLTETKDAILEKLSDTEELTEADIKERVGTKGIVSQAIRELLDERKLFRYGEGKRGNPYVYRKNPKNPENLENPTNPENFEQNKGEFLDTKNKENSENGISRNNADKQRAKTQFSDSGFVDSPYIGKSTNPENPKNADKLFSAVPNENQPAERATSKPAKTKCWNCGELFQDSEICPKCGKHQDKDLPF